MQNHQIHNIKRIPFFQVDAFTGEAFAGNPAAVCLLDEWLDDISLQGIARENNLSETAFVVKQSESYYLRWFTPAVEVDLCGHATLAAAHVLFSRNDVSEKNARFHTRSGELTVTKVDDLYSLDFPRVSAARIIPPEGLLSALGVYTKEVEVWEASDIVVVIDDEALLDALSPDMLALSKFETRGVVVTTRSRDYDFRSRWFGPQVGVDEDPVTGSAHTFLAPLWAGKLSKTVLSAQQGANRRGEITCRLKGENRVELIGKARMMIEGFFLL